MMKSFSCALTRKKKINHFHVQTHPNYSFPQLSPNSTHKTCKQSHKNQNFQSRINHIKFFTANFYRSFKLKKIRLAEKDLFGSGAKLPYFGLRELHLFGGPAILRRDKPPYKIVDNTLVHHSKASLRNPKSHPEKPSKQNKSRIQNPNSTFRPWVRSKARIKIRLTRLLAKAIKA